MNIYLEILLLTILQNASFTWVSRARNSGSYKNNAIASVFSNGIWLLVFRKLSLNLEDPYIMVLYIIGTVTGSVLMQWVSIRFIEKKKAPK
jgi:hypothetical protein